MFRRIIVTLFAVVAALGSVSFSAEPALAGKYLVKAEGGPGPDTPEAAVELLEGFVLPTMEMVMKWEEEGKVVGGLPVGGRAFVMIVDAASNHDLDRMLRSLPMWPLMEWHVVPLESAAGRAEIERTIVNELKEMMKK